MTLDPDADQRSYAIREAKAAEAEAIAALHAASWRSAYRGLIPEDALGPQLDDEKREKWRGALREVDSDRIVLCAVAPEDATAPGALLGFAYAMRDPKLANGALLDHLHVAPAAKGRGIGRALMAAVVRRLQEIGCRQLHLHVIAGNLGADRFYTQLGGRRGLVSRGPVTHGPVIHGRVIHGPVTPGDDLGPPIDFQNFFWNDLPALVARAEGTAPTQAPTIAIPATDIPATYGATHPIPAAEKCRDREKRALGDVFGLDQFGVNLVTLPPGAWSTVRHWHSHEDEFVYIVEGALTLVTERGETLLTAGACAGFKAGVPDGHRLENRSGATAIYLEVGSRRADVDETDYVDEDLVLRRDRRGRRVFMSRAGETLSSA